MTSLLSGCGIGRRRSWRITEAWGVDQIVYIIEGSGDGYVQLAKTGLIGRCKSVSRFLTILCANYIFNVCAFRLAKTTTSGTASSCSVRNAASIIKPLLFSVQHLVHRGAETASTVSIGLMEGMRGKTSASAIRNFLSPLSLRVGSNSENSSLVV